jgi:hypothetical protein
MSQLTNVVATMMPKKPELTEMLLSLSAAGRWGLGRWNKVYAFWAASGLRAAQTRVSKHPVT